MRMERGIPVTGWMLLRIAAPAAAIGATLLRLATDWPSGHALARIWILAAVAWLVGRVGQWVDNRMRRRDTRPTQ